MTRVLSVFATVVFLCQAILGQDCVDSRCETRPALASRTKVGEGPCLQTNPPAIYLTKTVKTTEMRRGGYTLDGDYTYVLSYNIDGWTTEHTEGEYTVDGLPCNSSNPCQNSWSDTDWEVDISECSNAPCTDLEKDQWATEFTNAEEYFTYDPETGALYYSILDWEDECTPQKKRTMFHWKDASNGWEEQVESIETYSDEYTSPMLVDKFNEDLWLAVSSPTSSWQDNSNAATYSLDHEALQTASGQALQYRFRILGNQGSAYRLRWQPVTLYTNQTKATFGPIQDEMVYGTGTTNYSRTHIEMPSTDATNTWTYMIYYGAEMIAQNYECSACGRDKREKHDHPAPGNAKLNLEFGGPRFSASLGSGWMGKSAGEIIFSARQSVSNLANPKLLEVWDPSLISEVLYSNDGTITQVKAPQCLAEVSVTNEFTYAINFYSPDNVGGKTNGLYYHSGSPYVSWVFQHAGGYAPLTINEVRGGTVITNSFEWDGVSGWGATLGNGLTKTTFSASFHTDTQTVTAEQETVDPQNPYIVLSRLFRKFEMQEGRLLLVEEQNGTDAPTTFQYDGEGNLIDIIRPDGSWQYRHYHEYSEGMIDYIWDGWLNSTNQSGDARLTYFDYASYDTNDDLTLFPRIPRYVEESLFDNILGRRYTMIRPNVREDRIVQNSDGWEGDPKNLILITTNYSSGVFTNYPLSVSHANGTMDVYFYATNSTGWVKTRLSGEPNASYPATNIVNGTKQITTYGFVGETISEAQYDLGSGILLSSKVCTNFDAFRRPLRYYYLDGTFEGFGYACCGLEAKTNRNGTVTYFSYDDLKRLQATTEQGITYINSYDAADRLLSTIRQGTNGSQITLFSRGYDGQGRIIAETNSLGGVTLFSQGFNASGELLRTNLNVETGGTFITRTARDGSLIEISGTAANPTKYYYDVESTGDSSPDGPVSALYVKEVKVTATGGEDEWTKTYQNMLGVPYRRVYAASNSSPTLQLYFNEKAQITKVVDPDDLRWLFQYDNRGRLEYEALDINRDDSINWNGSDRITRIQRSVLYDSALGGDVLREQRYVWPTAGVNSSNLISSVAASTAGLSAWGVIWNGSGSITNKFQISYLTNNLTRLTATYPNGASQVIDSIGGRVQLITDKDSFGAQVTQTGYSYDSHGRPQYVTDARNGTTTRAFNEADQVISITTPSPGNGQPTQTTTASYDKLGRVWRIQQPDGGYTTNEYTLKDQQKRVSGALTYPVDYGYDAQGRLTTMTNYQDFATKSGARVTEWKFDGYRGFETNKVTAGVAGRSFGYTPGGRWASRTWARGITTTYAYDNSGDLYSINYSDGITAGVTNTYDRVGRLSTVAYNGTTTTRTYNGASELLSESYAGGTLGGLAVTNGYDALLRRSSARVATYSTTLNSYTYDAANRLSTVGDTNNGSATYAYVTNSPLIAQVLSKQGSNVRLTSDRSYDLLDRLYLMNSVPSGGNTRAFLFGYGYNQLNQRVTAGVMDDGYWKNAYDWRGQLTNSVRRWSDNSLVAGEQYSYAFDDIGNRKSTLQGGDLAGQNLRSATYTNNTQNQVTGRGVPGAVDIIGSSTSASTVLVNGSGGGTIRHGSFFRNELAVANTSAPAWTTVTVSSDSTKTGHILTPPAGQTFAYDADGNLTNDMVWTYVWDAENRLTEIKPLTNNPAESKRWLKFAYDWRHRRIQKTAAAWNTNSSTWSMTVSNRFLYSGWNTIGELNATNNALIRGYIWGTDMSGTLQGAGGVGGLVAINDPVDGTQFAVNDDEGNVVGLVSADTGAVTAIYEYDPFGQLIRASGSYAQKNPIRFSSKYYDDEVGLSNYGFRYYSASLGRWINKDPIEEFGGLNLYGFVYNDPLSYIDPFGLSDLTDQAFLNMYQNGLDDASRYLRQLGSGLMDDLEDMARSSIKNALNPAGHIEDLINEINDTAEEIRKRLAMSECERKKALKKQLDYLASPEGIADFTRGVLEFLASRFLEEPGCFVAGTLVMTESGLRPIEEIKPGDRVWSYNEATGQIELNTVTSIVRKPVDLLVSLQIGSEPVVTTLGHPFWVENVGWVDAGRLAAGDLIKIRDGESLPVKSVKTISQTTIVYNFDVEPAHNYFVSKEGFLVHNPGLCSAKKNPTKSGKTRLGISRNNPADWRETRDLWDRTGYGDILSDANRAAIAEGRTPVVDQAWINHFPEDAGRLGERITMHHIGGGPMTVPLPASRHLDAHMPGGFRYNPGGTGL